MWDRCCKEQCLATKSVLWEKLCFSKTFSKFWTLNLVGRHFARSVSLIEPCPPTPPPTQWHFCDIFGNLFLFSLEKGHTDETGWFNSWWMPAVYFFNWERLIEVFPLKTCLKYIVIKYLTFKWYSITKQSNQSRYVCLGGFVTFYMSHSVLRLKKKKTPSNWHFAHAFSENNCQISLNKDHSGRIMTPCLSWQRQYLQK